MPRYARVLSNTSIYHVMLRGNERKQIFIDDEDKQRMIDTIIDKCQKEKAELIAYCLMDNHIHIIFGVLNNLDVLIKRIAVSYVYYFNKKYRRIGHLFHDRFKSENIENEEYLLEAVKYVHNNPVKAGIVNNPLNYKWSSFAEYFRDDSVNRDGAGRILEIFSSDKRKARKLFMDFCSRDGESGFIEYDGRTSDEKRQNLEQEASGYYVQMLSAKGLQKGDLILKERHMIREEIVNELNVSMGLSIRQISKITGIGRGIVQRIIAKNICDSKNRP